MGKRLNDTSAVVGMTPYESPAEHYSRTVRKISNGYLTAHYGTNPNDPDSYDDAPNSREVFTRDHPDLKDSSMMDRNANAMTKAVGHLHKYE
jgi:hypothetical protein